MLKLNLKKIKSASFVLLFLGLLFFVFLPQVQALQVSNYPGFLSNLRPGMPLTELISTLFNFLLMIAGLTSFIMIVWGGVSYLTSAGDPSKSSDARDQIFNAVLGLVIMLASWMILNTINPQLVELKEPGLADEPAEPTQQQPTVVGHCAENQSYNIKLYSGNNYKPSGKPINCYNNNESEKTFSKRVYSVESAGGSIKFYDEPNFTGKSICFTSSYPNLENCVATCASILFIDSCPDKWHNNIKSLQVGVSCSQPGITLDANGNPFQPKTKCAGY